MITLLLQTKFYKSSIYTLQNFKEAINAAAKLTIVQIMRAYTHYTATGFHHNYMVRWQSRRAPAESTLLVVSLTDATDADLALQNASTLNDGGRFNGGRLMCIVEARFDLCHS